MLTRSVALRANRSIRNNKNFRSSYKASEVYFWRMQTKADNGSKENFDLEIPEGMTYYYLAILK